MILGVSKKLKTSLVVIFGDYVFKYIDRLSICGDFQLNFTLFTKKFMKK